MKRHFLGALALTCAVCAPAHAMWPYAILSSAAAAVGGPLPLVGGLVVLGVLIGRVTKK